LKKISLWTASDLSKAFNSSKSGELVIRLGVLSSVSESGAVFESYPKETPFFESAAGEEKNSIDLNWQKFGSRQLVEIANSIEPGSKDASSSANLIDSCSSNKYDYDTSWCKNIPNKLPHVSM
jgi:hypothetical protein